MSKKRDVSLEEKEKLDKKLRASVEGIIGKSKGYHYILVWEGDAKDQETIFHSLNGTNMNPNKTPFIILKNTVLTIFAVAQKLLQDTMGGMMRMEPPMRPKKEGE
ncbi:MAG: hypothetical protein AB1468_00010 [Candidatus Micrarchaeota archaeon]